MESTSYSRKTEDFDVEETVFFSTIPKFSLRRTRGVDRPAFRGNLHAETMETKEGSPGEKSKLYITHPASFDLWSSLKQKTMNGKKNFGRKNFGQRINLSQNAD